jgi:tetratricopeptide (TPR) repeat protein
MSGRAAQPKPHPDLIKALELHSGGRTGEAEVLYRKVLNADGTNFYALHQLALILLDRRENADALSLLAAAVEQRPDSAEALANLGLALNVLGSHEQAVLACDHALALDKKQTNAWLNRSSSLTELDRYEEAVASADRAIALAPKLAQAHYNRGNALRELGRSEEALAAYTRAIELAPNYTKAHFNEGLTRLRAGDFAGGWPKYEYRWKRPETPARAFAQPQWDGVAPLAGRTILLHAEQGFGDTIQFARYAPMVAERGATVILEVQKALLPLFEGSTGVAQVVPADSALPAFDLHCPLLSLPGMFRTEIATIPHAVPYLFASAERRAYWTPHMPPATGPRVALCWAGNPNHNSDRHRSIPAPQLAPLLAVPGVQFASVQKDLRETDMAFLANTPVLNFGLHLRDFGDAAAILSMCDLVITVDTAIAHLAGALGLPVWILVQHSPDFRWLMQREDSPWYPTARLYRQPKVFDWESVIARLAGDLASFRDQKSSSGNPT